MCARLGLLVMEGSVVRLALLVLLAAASCGGRDPSNDDDTTPPDRFDWRDVPATYRSCTGPVSCEVGGNTVDLTFDGPVCDAPFDQDEPVEAKACARACCELTSGTATATTSCQITCQWDDEYKNQTCDPDTQ